MPELVAESFAPWSEKARWALDHHGIRYAYREHVPLVGEPLLRWRLGKLSGRVSTPTLLTDGAVYGDSFAIAEWAERHGNGTPLFPAERAEDIAVWNARSEAALAAGRVRVVARLTEVRGATSEILPPSVPGVMRIALQPMVWAATGVTCAFLRWKYEFGADVAATGCTLRATLEELRAALAGRDYLLDGLTYADITMAVVLQMVCPVHDAYIRLGPRTREVWTHESLAGDFADLVAWRDQLYDRHRGALVI